MNRLAGCLLSSIFFACLTSIISDPIVRAAGREWTMNGPEGGTVVSLAIDPENPQTVYAGTNTGVFKSTDGGTHWAALNIGIGPINSIVADPQSPRTIYAVSARRLFKSTNGGSQWNRLEITGSCLAIDSQNSQTLYACTTDGVSKSTDGGSHWSVLNTGFTNTTVLAIDPKDSHILYAGTPNAGVFKSNDGGDHWSTLAGLISGYIDALKIDPVNQTIYAKSNVLLKSTDGGDTWQTVWGGSPGGNYIGYGETLAIDPLAPQTLYIATAHHPAFPLIDSDSGSNGIWKSTDGGTTWVEIGPDIRGFQITPFWSLAIDPLDPRKIFLGAMGFGAFKSIDGGKHWESVNMGLTLADIRSLAVDPTSPRTAYAGSYENVFKTTDGGTTWNALDVPPTSYYTSLAIDPFNSQIIYAGSYDVIRSTDGGGTWKSIGEPERTFALAIDPKTPKTLFAGTEEGVLKSTDGGDNWVFSHGPYKSASRIDPPGEVIPIPARVLSLSIDPVNPQTLYAGTYDNGVHKSMDGGENWSAINTGLTTMQINALAIDPEAPEIIYAGTNRGAFKSTDAGDHWSAVGGLTSILSLAIDPTDPQTIYAGGWRTFKSADGGESWAPVDAGLPSGPVNALAISLPKPHLVYAGVGDAGVWTSPAECSDFYMPGGVVQCETPGEDQKIRVGYAKLAADPAATVYGTAVFSFRQNGITVTEAAIPSSPPTTKGRIFVDRRYASDAVPGKSNSLRIDINTGIAVVNCGSGTANIVYTLRDLNGAVLVTGNGTLSAGKHFAKFVDQFTDIAPEFNLPLDFQFGSLDIESNQPLSTVALRMTINQNGEVLYTTTPVTDLTKALSHSPSYFPHFANGGGYTTSMVLLNTSNRVEAGTLQILDNNGDPLVINQAEGVSGSSFSYSIPSGGAFRFQTDGSPTSTATGWIRVIPDFMSSTPVSSGAFAYYKENRLVSESWIPATATTSHARIYVDLSGNHNTGLAIANPASMNADITIKAFKDDGVTEAGNNQYKLELNARAQDAKFVDQYFEGLPYGFTGVLDIESSTPFAALTLRMLTNERDDALMTAFPVADLSATPPSPVLFPQVADGGGYITEFILINAGLEGADGIHFYDEEGAPADFSK